MAFGTIGGFLNGSSKTSGTTVVTSINTTAGGLTAGSLVIVFVGKDNVSTTDGNTSEVSGISDSVGGNTYTALHEYCNSRGSANAGAVISIWYSILTNALLGTSTITATLSSSVTAKAIAAKGFTKGSSTTISLVGSSDVNVVSTTGLGSPSITGLASAEHLYLIGDASETSTTDSGASATGFTQDTSANTSGGSSASNMGVNCYHLIATDTGQSPTTSGGASATKAVTMIALVEVSPAAPIIPSIVALQAVQRAANW